MASATIKGIGGAVVGGLGTVTVATSEGVGIDDGTGSVALAALAKARILDVADAVINYLNGLGSLLGVGGDLAFVRAYSFGFPTDPHGIPIAPTTLELLVRPMDFQRATGDHATEERTYVIQIGAFKIVSKFNTAEIDLYLNLMTAVANLFYLNADFTLSGAAFMRNDNDGKFAVVDGDFEVHENRFLPLFFHDARTMDAANEAMVLFDCRLQIGFVELGRPVTEAT